MNSEMAYCVRLILMAVVRIRPTDKRVSNLSSRTEDPKKTFEPIIKSPTDKCCSHLLLPPSNYYIFSYDCPK